MILASFSLSAGRYSFSIIIFPFIFPILLIITLLRNALLTVPKGAWATCELTLSKMENAKHHGKNQTSLHAPLLTLNSSIRGICLSGEFAYQTNQGEKLR